MLVIQIAYKIASLTNVDLDGFNCIFVLFTSSHTYCQKILWAVCFAFNETNQSLLGSSPRPPEKVV